MCAASFFTHKEVGEAKSQSFFIKSDELTYRTPFRLHDADLNQMYYVLNSISFIDTTEKLFYSLEALY